MSTYTSIIYQVVFATKFRKPTLSENIRPELFNYIGSIISNKSSLVHAINGTHDHVHIAFTLHPSVALSNIVKDIKVASTLYLKSEFNSPFDRWQSGYGAFTYSLSDLNRLKAYIAKQEEHHRKISFEAEYRNLLNEHGIEYNPKYLL